MIIAAMLLLVSDWLVIAGNYGIGGGGGHLQGRQLTDKPGLHNWLGKTGMEDGNKNDSHPGKIGEMEGQYFQRKRVTDFSHEGAQQETDTVPPKIDKLGPLQKRSRGGSSASKSTERNITLTSAMLKPLFRVHLDTTVKRARWAAALNGPNRAIFSEKSVTKTDSHFYRDKTIKKDDGLVNDENNDRLNHSTTHVHKPSQPFSANTSSIFRRTTVESPPHINVQAFANVSKPMEKTPEPALTSAPLRHQRRRCDAFEKRCENGRCVSHIVPCPQKACPVSRPFRCQNKWQCISLFKRCDGDSHCEDGSDEKGCDRLSYPYSHNRRIVVVATIIIVVIGISLFCCVLIHVYRTAQNSHPTHLSTGSALLADNTDEVRGDSATWSVLAHLRRLLPPHLTSLEHDPTRRAGPSSSSFQSMGSSVTQPFLSPHDNPPRHIQSETLQSFLSASDSVAEVADSATANPEVPAPDYSWTMERAGPPPPYEEVVSLGDLGERRDVRSPTRRGLYQEREPPPTYESIFCIEV